MAINPIYDSAEIVAEVKTGRRFFPYFINIAFGLTRITNAKYLVMDKKSYVRGMMPLTDYKTPAVVLAKTGYKTEVFQPAYFKALDSVEFEELDARQFGGNLYESPIYADALIQLAGEHYDRWNRTKEYLASQILRIGQVNITGQDYATYTLDFGRKAELSVTLTGADRWGESGNEGKPMKDIEDFVENLDKPCKRITFGHNAWKNFKADPAFEKLVDTRYRNITEAQRELGATQMPEDRSDIEVGRLPSLGVTLYTYKDYITDIEGNQIDLIGTDEVIFTPDPALGTVGYARIKDTAANYKGMPIFFKNWEENQPGMPFLLSQSNMLPYHINIDATGYMKTR